MSPTPAAAAPLASLLPPRSTARSSLAAAAMPTPQTAKPQRSYTAIDPKAIHAWQPMKHPMLAKASTLQANHALPSYISTHNTGTFSSLQYRTQPGVGQVPSMSAAMHLQRKQNSAFLVSNPPHMSASHFQHIASWPVYNDTRISESRMQQSTPISASEAASLKRKRTKNADRDPLQPPFADQSDHEFPPMHFTFHSLSTPSKNPGAVTKAGFSNNGAVNAPQTTTEPFQATTELGTGDVVLFSAPSPHISFNKNTLTQTENIYTLALCTDDVSINYTNADAKITYTRLLSFNDYATTLAADSGNECTLGSNNSTGTRSQFSCGIATALQLYLDGCKTAQDADNASGFSLDDYGVFVVEDIKRIDKSGSVVPDFHNRIWILTPEVVRVAIGRTIRTFALIPKGDIEEALHLVKYWTRQEQGGGYAMYGLA